MHIHEVTLAAADLEAQQAFYAGTLGLPEVAAEPGSVAFAAGRSRLVFRAAPPPVPQAHIAFAIAPGAFAEAAEWLTQRVAPIQDTSGATTFFHPSWNADAIYFSDPAGHILELIARRATPEMAAGDPPIQAICEVGLVADDVLGAAAAFVAQLGLDTSPDDDELFRALGDDEGMIILVKRGRIWFPETGVAATPAVIAVVVEGRHGITRLEGW
jgi:catechol-2,3-dioxygenase